MELPPKLSTAAVKDGNLFDVKHAKGGLAELRFIQPGKLAPLARAA